MAHHYCRIITKSQISRAYRLLLLALLGCFASLTLGIGISSGVAQAPALLPEQQAIQDYQSGRWEEAVSNWQQAAQTYQKQADPIGQARVASNLALAYQQLDQWPAAEGAIAESLALLESATARSQPAARLTALAQALNNQGSLQLAKGQPQAALTTWQQAGETYAQIRDASGVLRSQINQSLALQDLGFYDRACQRLSDALQLPPALCHNPAPQAKAALSEKLAKLPSPLDSLQVAAWQNFADLLQIVGQPAIARSIFQALDSRAASGEERASLLLSLAKAAQAQQDLAAALDAYRQAGSLTTSAEQQLASQLPQLSLLSQTGQWQAAVPLFSAIPANFAPLPASHRKLSAQLNFASQLMRLRQREEIPPEIGAALPTWEEIAAILTSVRQQAQRLQDGRMEAYALGNLGLVAQKKQQWAAARQLTEQGLRLAEAIRAPEIAYRWQGELGRIAVAVGERQQAIAAYGGAIATLESIRNDLAANPELQASFQETIDPLYREFVALLLQPDSQGQISQENLRRARQAMESLQQAELIDFLGQDCLKTQAFSIDRLDPRAAVIYSILLPERLAVILQLPQQQDLHYYSTAVPAATVKETTARLRYNLVIRSRREFFAPAAQLYDWLVRPAEALLQQAGSETLAFVVDSALRNVPMNALYDGERYLVEKYAIALTPGLQLLNPTPLQQHGLEALAAGIGKARQEFPPLYFVPKELAAIQQRLSATVLLDRQFTKEDFAQALAAASYPIVHIATHGQFSSDIDRTFLLTWDGTVNLRQLAELLQAGELSRERSLELLFLSACQTAVGDARAALGLAGTAVKSGARSTIATLWPVNDEASAQLIRAFYEALAQQKLAKAASLRQAQLTLLNSEKYRHPYYWAAYVLVGNWL